MNASKGLSIFSIPGYFQDRPTRSKTIFTAPPVFQGAEVVSALNGRAASRWRSSPDERAVIVSAAHPVRAGNELVGAVVMEETTNSIQTLQT